MIVKSIIEQTRESLLQLQSFDSSRLPRTKELGDYLNFEEAVPFAERLIRLFKRIHVDSLGDIPDSELSKIKQYSDTVNNLFTETLTFKPDEPDSSSKRQQLIYTLRDFYQEAFRELIHLISYTATSDSSLEMLRDETHKVIDYHNSRINEQFSTIDNLKNTVSEMADATKGMASGLGMGYHSRCFLDQSTKDKQSFRNWLITALACCIITTLYAVYLWISFDIVALKDIQIFQYISMTAPKIILLSVLIFSTAFSAKNYFACKHNATINQHRHNALITYTAIAAGAKTDAQADAIVGQASNCIFSHQPTGYTAATDIQCGPTLSPVTQMLLGNTKGNAS